ncbi:hypothetical protein Z043_118680 [Scleropages formosus]|uniref:Uncharacterized protein n=1 Tax=Scleropages formosus TaxID=113540 RepID=A0A0P7UU16_SCLFO|nr:hypothetical protein Z043_118680 [Scleropages formosus]
MGVVRARHQSAARSRHAGSPAATERSAVASLQYVCATFLHSARNSACTSRVQQ